MFITPARAFRLPVFQKSQAFSECLQLSGSSGGIQKIEHTRIYSSITFILTDLWKIVDRQRKQSEKKHHARKRDAISVCSFSKKRDFFFTSR